MTSTDPDARRRRLAARIAEARASRSARPVAAPVMPAAPAATSAPAAPAADVAAGSGPVARAENDAALEDFLKDLSGGLGLAAWPAPEARAGWAEPGRSAVLPFPRPGAAAAPAEASSETPADALSGPAPGRPPAAALPVEAAALDALAAALEAACDLEALPGAGPGLIWALKRAGVRRMDDLAGLEAAALAERMGPVGRLAPLERWIGVARSARA